MNPAAYSFPLDGREIRIGRDASCDLVLAGVGVSRLHAVIRCGEEPAIADSGSKHGIRLNGNPITEAALQSGSSITVGIHILQVFIDNSYISLTILNSDEDAEEEISVDGEDNRRVIKIGRDAANDIRLPHPMVSRFHAVVRSTPGGLTVTDQGSENSTYVNGRAVNTAALGEGDVVHIGPFRFFVTGGKFCRADSINKIRIDTHALGVCIKGKKLLDDINLTIEPGAFVALLGASGAGKSTLSKVLSGQLAPTSGRLFMNGFPAAKFSAAFARGIGYVSQQILLRPELTVWETLADQSLMRLPGDSTEKERLARAEEVLELTGLTNLRERRVANLSGGEARRLHVGVELLASPAVIILDEPLAGLDPGLIGKFMRLFRHICDKGHTLILITHTLEQIEICDRVVYIQAGKVLFSGKPDEACAHFNTDSFARIYDTDCTNDTSLCPQTPSDTSAANNTGGQRRAVFTQKLQAHSMPAGAEWKAALCHPVHSILFFMRQSLALTARYSKVYIRDRRNMFLLMAQTPLITLLLGLVYTPSILQFPVSFYFCLTVTGIWVGGLDAVREVAAEIPLLVREMKCGMKRISYITARIITAALLSVAQSLLFAAFAIAVFRNLDFSAELLVLLFTSIFAGNLLGLAVSACSGSVGRAISTLPIVLIPQIFFSGILVHFERMAELGRQISHLTIARPVFGVMKKVFFLERPLFWHTEWTELFLLCA